MFRMKFVMCISLFVFLLGSCAPISNKLARAKLDKTLTQLAQMDNLNLVTKLDDDFSRWSGKTSCGQARTWLFFGIQQPLELVVAELGEQLEQNGWTFVRAGQSGDKDYLRSPNEYMVMEFYTSEQFVDVWKIHSDDWQNGEVMRQIKSEYAYVISIQVNYYLPDWDHCR